MSIENNLERIATALEVIAKGIQQAPKVEVKPVEYQELSRYESEVETPEVETPEVETPKVETPKVETPKVETPKVSFKDINTAFFAMLGLIRDNVGIDRAKEVGSSILKEFSGGKPLTTDSLPESSYADIAEFIKTTVAEYE